jgi:RNA polymerase sigma-70 factor (ECF subfamily)
MAVDSSGPGNPGGSHVAGDHDPGPDGSDDDAPSDAALVQQIVSGSEAALAALYDRHGGAVYATAMRVSGNDTIAAEVVQDTFLGLWNRAERYDPGRGSLATWLQAIARNRAIDRFRMTARRLPTTNFSAFTGHETDNDGERISDWLAVSGELVAAGEPEPTPELALADVEQRESIRRALGSLGPLERQVILLAYQSGLSQSEIAAHLNWPLGTVKTRTRRALQLLREQLERAEVAPRRNQDVASAGDLPCWQMSAAPRAGMVATPCS